MATTPAQFSLPRPRPANAPSRRVFLDWLRIAALLTLVPYHVGMYYVPWPWHVKSPNSLPELAAWMQLSSPWRMSLLFLISGAVLSLALTARPSQAAWLRARTLRLLLPLLVGIVLVVPVQPYFEVRQFHGYTGSFGDFAWRYFSADKSFCQPGRGCLVLPTWNHLWYLPYLMFYTALLWCLLRWRPSLLDDLAAHLARWLRVPCPPLSGSAIPLAALRQALPWALPVVWLLATRLVLREHFPPSHALVDDWLLHSQYLPIFLLGAVLARTPHAWEQAEALRWPALALAGLGWLVLTGTLHLLVALPGARSLAGSLMQWCGIVAALGFAHRHWQADGPWRQRLSDAVFPVYLLHQSVIIGLAMVLAPAGLSPWQEAPVLMAGALAVGMLGWWATVWWPGLAPWLGGAKSRETETIPAAGITAPSNPQTPARR